MLKTHLICMHIYICVCACVNFCVYNMFQLVTSVIVSVLVCMSTCYVVNTMFEARQNKKYST